MAGQSKQDLQAAARQIAGRVGLTPEQAALWMGLIEQESGWNPNAVGPETRKYGKAKGLGQLIDATARALGVTDVHDPLQNLNASARYFKQQLDRFGDPGLALAAYNWGPDNVRGLLENPRRYQVPAETAKYVPNVFDRAAKYGEPPAPTTPTLAFFPGTEKSARKAVDAQVQLRAGKAGPAAIEAQIKTRGAPSAAGMAPGPVAAGGGGLYKGTAQRGDEFTPPLAERGVQVPSVGSAAPSGQAFDTQSMNAVPEPADLAQRTQMAAHQPKTLDQFLRKQFGPIADVADPLPKAYDAELRRIIDEA